MPMSTKHLDLGCGPSPRNPYRCEETHGIDLALPADVKLPFFVAANLSVEPIPHEDSTFDSVSAYDFLEHVPRVLPGPDGSGTRFSFVELMSEIHRVLKPSWRFYAVTPAFPRAEAFVDPTHVKVITERTHLYLAGETPGAHQYGFRGRFRVLRAHWTRKRLSQDYEPVTPDLVHRLRRLLDVLKRRRHHMLWELEAVK
ncbi:MAG: methyltransferase domain-containing protein [Candidatus Riflebacteria bacterium]|nr:methyltransferase domain-containing protein [Candidatus Riflebacteria bacterium]